MNRRPRRRSRTYGPIRVNLSGHRLTSITCWWGPFERLVIWQGKRRG